LIGGPNQSHKVNFKEPPNEGKRTSKNFFGTIVNIFSRNSENFLTKSFQKNASSMFPLGIPVGLLIEGTRNMQRVVSCSSVFIVDF
jgi:hypothetical protein